MRIIFCCLGTQSIWQDKSFSVFVPCRRVVSISKGFCPSKHSWSNRPNILVVVKLKPLPVWQQQQKNTAGPLNMVNELKMESVYIANNGRWIKNIDALESHSHVHFTAFIDQLYTIIVSKIARTSFSKQVCSLVANWGLACTTCLHVPKWFNFFRKMVKMNSTSDTRYFFPADFLIRQKKFNGHLETTQKFRSFQKQMFTLFTNIIYQIWWYKEYENGPENNSGKLSRNAFQQHP